MATITPTVLCHAKSMESTQTTQFTATSATVVTKCVVTNTSSAAVTFSLNIVPSGGSVATSNKVIASYSIAAGASYQCPEVVGHTLAKGTVISTIAGTASVLTLRISGNVYT